MPGREEHTLRPARLSPQVANLQKVTLQEMGRRKDVKKTTLEAGMCMKKKEQLT